MCNNAFQIQTGHYSQPYFTNQPKAVQTVRKTDKNMSHSHKQAALTAKKKKTPLA